MNKDDVKKLADLAKMEISDTEMEKMATDIGSVLGYIDQIKDAPLASPKSFAKASVPDSDVSAEKAGSRIESSSVRNVMIEDENPHETGINTESLIAETPDSKDNYIKTKKIL